MQLAKLTHKDTMSVQFIHNRFLLAVLALFIVPAVASARTIDETAAAAGRQGLLLKLVGTAVSDDPGNSVAVIVSGKGGQQRSYHKGERVGGVLIREIFRNRITVETEQGEEVTLSSRSLPTDVMRSEANQAPPPVGFATSPTKSRRHKTLYLDGKTLAAELADFGDKIQEVNIDAVSIYGQPTGVRIYPIAADSIFSKIGLKTGDVIKEVNGMEISRPEEAIAVFQQLKAGHDVDIKVKGRRTRQISLIIE